MQLPQYQPESPLDPLSDDELSALDDQLADLPGDGALNIEALDGYLCGLLLSPQPLAERPGADWLPLIWSSEGAEADPFGSGKQRKRLVLAVLRHLRALDHELHQNPQAWEPILSVAEDDEGEWVDALDWCAGFMLAVDLDAEAWAPRLQDPEWAELLAPIALLGADEETLTDADRARLDDLSELDALSRSVPEAVLGMAAR